MEINLYQKASMRIGKIVTGAEYPMDKQFPNFPTFAISRVFQIEKVLKIC